jgi:hypothetical protein
MTTLHTWTADIIRVLSNARPYMSMNELCQRLWVLRNNAGFKPPKAFIETVQSTLNHHTSQSMVWRKNGARPEDDLFYSPRGKGSGTWAVHRDQADVWLETKGFPEPGDPVMALALNIAREMVRNTIKAKGFNMAEWPASCITHAAKQLLDAQGENGRIVTTARRHVEAERPLS